MSARTIILDYSHRRVNKTYLNILPYIYHDANIIIVDEKHNLVIASHFDLLYSLHCTDTTFYSYNESLYHINYNFIYMKYKTVKYSIDKPNESSFNLVWCKMVLKEYFGRQIIVDFRISLRQSCK